MTRPELERLSFGVMADKDEHPHVFSHSDRFLVVDLKNRKEIVAREYRPNPYAQICKEKYPIPTDPGENISDEELEIYRQIAEIVKDCKYAGGKNFGYFVKLALEKAGTESMMLSFEPQGWIDSLIENRYMAGYRD
ncbi:MAG: hypothetical protein DRR08_22885 [Candidatus Parabeggiatoa sp. nov. 2]|nr:MAG: hypothetical protein B6247_28965 [Beggiatoa sp. 4572_84]RKZ55968.1 MAG: hypothetical protein DRR08_22885 [Gammaproteobacteria bacterium]